MKSTNTGCPDASNCSTRPGAQACQGPLSVRADCCSGVRVMAGPAVQASAASTATESEASTMRARPRRVKDQTTMLSATSSASSAPAPSMPALLAQHPHQPHGRREHRERHQPAEGLHPGAGPRQQARDRRDPAGGQVGQGHADADHREQQQRLGRRQAEREAERGAHERRGAGRGDGDRQHARQEGVDDRMARLQRGHAHRQEGAELEQPGQVQADQREQRGQCRDHRRRLQLEAPAELLAGRAQGQHQGAQRRRTRRRRRRCRPGRRCGGRAGPTRAG